MKKALYLLGALALLGVGGFAQYAWTNHAAMARHSAMPSTQVSPTQEMMLAAQEDHGRMMMPTDKPMASSGTGMSGCGMSGGNMSGMGDTKGGAKSGMMGDMKGCPMMAQTRDMKGISGCCCANMSSPGETPKKPA
jgi:hypothetical protein